MARELNKEEMDLFELIMSEVVGNSITLDGFNTIAAMVKKEYSQRVIL